MRQLADFQNPPPLTHLKRLTAKDGLLQHADLEVPDPAHGYSLDDNARAVIATLAYNQLFDDPTVLRLTGIYFDYLKRVERAGGSFHNFLSFTEQILDAGGSEDSIGRAVWALGEVARYQPSSEMVKDAKTMLARTKISQHLEHPHLRTKSYILLGLIAAGELEEAKPWANRLVGFYRLNRKPDWLWFEDSLRYDNAVIPFSLAHAAAALQNSEILAIAEESFQWLDQVSRLQDKPAPIGQAGWYYRGGRRAQYDQQPLDAAEMVLAATELYSITKKKRYLDTALEWINWYYGHNCLGVSLVNSTTNGIHDAITPNGVNKNQGAESIVSYLMAYLSLSRIIRSRKDD